MKVQPARLDMPLAARQLGLDKEVPMLIACGVNLREIVACLMCSDFYFELNIMERLALVKHLARDRSLELSSISGLWA